LEAKTMKITPFSRVLAAVAACSAGMVLAAGSSLAQSKSTVVEEIIARVNNSVITLSDYQKALASLPNEARQDCPACSAEQMQAQVADREKNALRDMIDQQLLIERAKDMDISVETDVIKRLDDVRKQNNLGTLDDLQKAIEAQGSSWEEYKTQIRNNLLTQEVIRREVGGRINIGADEIKAYYDSHKSEFNRPEEVVLAEIFLSTENKTGADIDAVQKRAQDLRKRVDDGEDFSELAKRYSESSTAAEGGMLGQYERGQLSKQFEDAVFGLPKNAMTDVIQTKTGFEFLKVVDHFQAGEQPLDAVQDEIQNKIYMQKMEPQMRSYLAELREESYVTVKPGFTDSAAVAGGTAIQEVAPTPDVPDKKSKKKMSLPKVS
jgi:peptidyl-prolyl cis-trans isomerase SurA